MGHHKKEEERVKIEVCLTEGGKGKGAMVGLWEEDIKEGTGQRDFCIETGKGEKE